MKIGDGVPNQTPNWSARWREQMRCAQVRKIRSKKNKKTLEPAAVVRDLSEARSHESVELGEVLCARSYYKNGEAFPSFSPPSYA